MKYATYARLLVSVLSISACTNQPTVSTTDPGAAAHFADLEAEYAPFTTQALTQNYLQRKLKQWVSTKNGEAMKRELRFGEFKHPATLSQVLDTPTLCAPALAFPEVVQERSTNPDLDSYLQEVSCGGLNYIGEFQANTTTAGPQSNPDSAMASDGSFVIVWSGQGNGGTTGIFGQRFLADGSKIGGEFEISTQSGAPKIAMAADGDFAVTWANDNNIFARAFHADATPDGSAFRVNTSSLGLFHSPAIDRANDGQYVITWINNNSSDAEEIYAQRYLANGTPNGTEFRVNSTNHGSQLYPAVAMADDGHFIITWQSSGQNQGYNGIYAQAYLSNGSADGGEFLVNTAPPLAHAGSPDIALSNTGEVIVTYEMNVDGTPDVYATRFHENDAFAQSHFLVNSHTLYAQNTSKVALNDNGDFIIVWQSVSQDHSGSGPMLRRMGVFAKAYTRDNDTLQAGAEFQVNTTVEDGQFRPAIAHYDHHFLISWSSFLQDGDGLGVYAQRMDLSAGSNQSAPLWK